MLPREPWPVCVEHLSGSAAHVMQGPPHTAQQPIRPEVCGGNTSDVATLARDQEDATRRDGLVSMKMPKFVRTRPVGIHSAIVMTDNCRDSNIRSALPQGSEAPPSLPIVAR